MEWYKWNAKHDMPIFKMNIHKIKCAYKVV